jgi:hypothetical protein
VKFNDRFALPGLVFGIFKRFQSTRNVSGTSGQIVLHVSPTSAADAGLTGRRWPDTGIGDSGSVHPEETLMRSSLANGISTVVVSIVMVDRISVVPPSSGLFLAPGSS